MTVSETVSAGQLRAFIERIERLEEEKKTIADDIKEVKAEARGTGFDVGAINALIKLRKMDSADRQEKEAILDMYMAALGMLPREEYADRDAAGQSYAEAKGVDRTTSKTEVVAPREPTHEQPVNPASQSASADTAVACEYAGTSSDENPAHSGIAQGRGSGSSAPVQVSSPAPATIPHSPAVLPGKADKTSEAVVPPAASLVPPFENPRCLNACHLAHSKDACHDCLIAWSQRPKDEQVRLWAEANEAAQVAA